MKSLIKITAALAIAILLSANLIASPINFTVEAYINDVPFNTSEIYIDVIAEQQLAEFDFEEEQYINDITIDTKCISAECLYQEVISVEFNFEEEQYIDDINL
jgi:hypothetical protein